MQYKLVIFDFDGTLADSFPWLLGVVNEVADRYNFKRLDPGAIEQLRGVDAAKAIAYTGVPRWKVPLIGNHVRSMMTRDIDKIRLFDGVETMLERLANEGVQLGILSSNSLTNIQRVLGPRNTALFSHYECGASIWGKQAKLRRLLKRSMVAPHEALCVGDEIRDVVAAHAEGVAFGAVTWGYANVDALRAYEPAEVFWSVGDIADRLTGQASVT
jgi:phosphoglycolate phosphatase